MSAVLAGGEKSTPIWDVGHELGMSESRAERIASELQELRMLHYTSLAGDVALTSFGVSEIFLAQSQPDMPTTHFPAMSSFTDQMMLTLVDPIPDLPTRLNLVFDDQSANQLHQIMDDLENTLQTQSVSDELLAELESLKGDLEWV